MNLILIFVFLITLFNASMLLLLYFFVNRNWEKLIEQGNQLRTFEKGIDIELERINNKLDK